MVLAEPAICPGLQSPLCRSSTRVISLEIRLCALRASRRRLIRCARSAAHPSPSWLRLSFRLMVPGDRPSDCAICRCVRPPAAPVPRSGIVPLESVACNASCVCLSGFGVRAAHSRQQLTHFSALGVAVILLIQASDRHDEASCGAR